MVAREGFPTYERMPSFGRPEIPPSHQNALTRTLRATSRATKELPVTRVTEVEGKFSPLPGVYLMGPECGLPRDGEISSISFDLAPLALSGRVDSAHAVLPGELGITCASGSSANVKMPVAVKNYYKRPVDDSFKRVCREIKITQQQAEAGEITYQPLAVIVAEPPYSGAHSNPNDYDIVLVTRLNPSATTLDNAPWRLGYQPENIMAAEAAVRALARFNTNIGAHGDAKIKNVAQLPDGQTSMIDFETSEPMDVTDPRAACVVVDDFASLLDSLVGRKFFSRQPGETTQVIEKLGEIYLEAWEGFSPEVQSAVVNEVARITEEYAERAH